MAIDGIDRIRVATPCSTSWEAMKGDAKVRHCGLCNLNVYNFAEMTRDEVHELLARTEGRVCARLYRRADGTILTRDCPTGLRALRRRASRIATAAIATVLTLPSFACSGWLSRKPRVEPDRPIRLTRGATGTSETRISGVVVVDGVPLPGTRVTACDEKTGQQSSVVTDANGVFDIAVSTDGAYRLTAENENMVPVQIEHLQLNVGQSIQASIAMELETTLGILVNSDASVIQVDAHQTTYPETFLDRLPH